MKKIMLSAFLLLLASLAWGGDECGMKAPCDSCHKLSLKEANDLLKNVAEVKSVEESAVKGLWQLSVEKDGRQGTVLMDFAKKHVLPGPIFSLDSPQFKNPPQKKVEKVDPAKLAPENALIMGNPKGTKKLYVFTDPDCPFCSRLHDDLKKLVKADPDVTIYVKLFPLPMHPDAYDKSRAIVAANSLDLLDKAFRREAIPKPEGDKGREAVDANLYLGNSLGITGTPTLVTADGRIIVGARDLEGLKKLLEEGEKKP